MLSKAIFLDRDGVINQAITKNGCPLPPSTLDELVILPGVRDALGRLKAAGFLLIVVTNQPDVARGVISMQSVEIMNNFLLDALPLDEIRTCFHDDSDNCACRKPRPGALLDAASLHSIDLPSSFMVGDRWRDIEAGRLAGCKTIFIDYGYAEKQPEAPNYLVSSLSDAVPYILGE